MNNHDIINDAKWQKLLEAYERKKKIEHAALCILAVVLFATAGSPVILQTLCSLFLKG